MNDSCVIAVDGPAASGKSSVSRLLARRLGFAYINSGLFYRAATWLALQLPTKPATTLPPAADLLDALHHGRLTSRLELSECIVLVDQTPLRDELAAPEVNAAVSTISAWPEVRSWLLGHLRDFARADSIVMEGRDIGSVVFPQASFKFFLDANPAIRQQRRQAQGIGDQITHRDQLDRSRANAPLTIPPDALRIDSSHLSLEQVVEKIYRVIRQNS